LILLISIDFINVVFQVLSSFQLLQEHCLQHAEHDQQNVPDHPGSIQTHSEEDQILIEISDSQDFQGSTISQDGQQFVVVYDVPTNQ
jgi:hypothetical protein